MSFELREVLLPDEPFQIVDGAIDLPKAYSPCELEKHLQNGDQILGAFDKTGLVGFTLYRQVCGEAELLFFYVVPGFRRGGLGTALLNGFLQVLRKEKVNRVFLEVSEVNTGAMRLYERAEFHVVGTRKQYYADGSSALVMSRALEDIAD